MVSGLHLNFEMNGIVNRVLTNGFCFCSDEELIEIHSSPEVVEVPPPPSPKVVEVPQPPPRRGPLQKQGKQHPARE